MLQVHFRDFPTKTLLAWEGSQPLLQAYLNSLKEAAVICSGNAAAILQMSQQSQKSLWNSVESADVVGFQKVSSSLQLTPRARGNKPASVPVRLHVQRESGGGLVHHAMHVSNDCCHVSVISSFCADYMSSYESVEYTSRPVGTVAKGQDQTLFQTLQQIAPHCIPSSSKNSISLHQAAPESQSAPAEMGTTIESSQATFLEQYTVLVAGIKPSLQTPLAWLHATLHAPDMFLYITVIAQR